MRLPFRAAHARRPKHPRRSCWRWSRKLNADPAIHGILVQLPLPKHIDEAKVLLAIDPDKDVDGFHPVNVGRLASGARDEALVPCTPAGSVILAKHALGDDLSGLEAVVVGRSNIVGKPVAQLLLAENCTVTICHSRTRDLAAVCRRGDILVAAVGRPEMVKGDWVKPGACVIDVGINRVPAPEKGEGKTKLVGDVDFAAASRVAGAITPVPGGVGPMTIAMLMANTVIAAARKAGEGMSWPRRSRDLVGRPNSSPSSTRRPRQMRTIGSMRRALSPQFRADAGGAASAFSC